MKEKENILSIKKTKEKSLDSKIKDKYQIHYSAIRDNGEIIMSGKCDVLFSHNRIEQYGLISVLSEFSKQLSAEKGYINFSIYRIDFIMTKKY